MDPEAREPGLGLSGPKATAVRAHGLHRGLRVHVAMLLLGPGMNLKLCASQGTFSGQAVQSCPCSRDIRKLLEICESDMLKGSLLLAPNPATSTHTQSLSLH